MAKEAGFSYQEVLGEAIYAMVICHFDATMAISFLARFANHPSSCHYEALKCLWRYFRGTLDWGLIYWRTKPVPELPIGDLMPESRIDESFPRLPHSFCLGIYVDAAYATNIKTQQSINGIVAMLGGMAINIKSKLQGMVAMSLTEAEFMAVVDSAKVAKYY